MKSLPEEEHIKSIDVMCPAFSADCLETIEEISGENREYFEEHGGERFQYIDCLNDQPDHIEFLAGLVERHAAGWPEADRARDRDAERDELAASRQRAEELLQKLPMTA